MLEIIQFSGFPDAGNNEPEPSSGSESTPSTTANPSIPETRREREVVSLLDRLRSPAASELSRKRKLSVNSVNTPGNGRSQTSVSRKANEPMKVSASQTVQEFKEESFIVSQNGALFCQSCWEELSLKKHNIAVHVSSRKHKANKEKMEKATEKERHVAYSIAKYD